MVFDNESFILKMNKHYIKLSEDIYLPEFKRNNELLIVSKLINYTRNFMVLLTDSIDSITRPLAQKIFL